ncbi:MAG: tRNA 2-thiouridine(34) synthase MnmA [Deltaproteobacteria bacterium]|jgi:tRNA-specific 2-thiouridylase|nr:tRNA 2-thiouridine(34) synthase MnmA [Deltaproteobacteria bacterium]
MKTAVAVSGGMDSLYALSALKAAGHELLALHGRFASARRDPLPGLREQCARLAVPLHVADLREEFRQRVIVPFVDAYAAGQTPNPCAHCNSAMKFGLLLDMAGEFGAQRLATGHYAAFTRHPAYGFTLRRAADPGRDQSYFLSLVPKERLARAVFPLADAVKSAIPGKLAGQGLAAPLPEESREICFVPDDDYRVFLEEYAERLPGPGPICLRDGRTVGRHEGLWRHTEGQRRGLGLAWSEALYVLEKDCARNSLVVGTAAELRVHACRTGRCNVFVPAAQWPGRVFVRTRYKQEAQAAEVEIEDGILHVRFHEPQTVCAPGQIACVYDGDGWVLAAGIIRIGHDALSEWGGGG